MPTTAWLADSGLALEDGVLCDARLAAVGADDAWAAGDVARWFHPGYGKHVRFEHWTVAADHGDVVAHNILVGSGEPIAHAPVPYVWSDQHGVKIQIAGAPGDEDEITVVRGDIDDERFLAITSRHGFVTGALAFAEPRWFMTVLAAMNEGPVTVDAAEALIPES